MPAGEEIDERSPMTTSETSSQSSSGTGRSGPSTAVSTRDAEPGGLETERGRTSIADSVVSKVAGIAAREIPGVHNLGGGAARALSGVTSAVGLGEARSQGVSVEVGDEEAAVDLTVVVDYGESIPQVTQAIRDNVAKRIEGIVGLRVVEVNVTVNDLYFPGDDDQQA
jgi:uncharacterized alkaline shock family protein YloU